MRHLLRLLITIFMLTILATPRISSAEEPANKDDDGAFYLGSFVISILHLPLKAATCLGTQAGAAVTYAATYGVPGNYEGTTNGKDIGEVARRSCTGAWFISPEQIKKDYGN
jgi:hypothetical protein